jgi:hypothetical protein
VQNHLAPAQLSGTVNQLNTLLDLYGDGTDYNLLPLAGSCGGNIPYACTFLWFTPFDTINLKTSLSASDNFFYLGHGNKSSIGNNGNPGQYLLASQIAFLLGNYIPQYGYLHKNRLTILYSCLSYSKAFCNAFGVNYYSHASVVQYQSLGNKPRAFVGWPSRVDAPLDSPLGWLQIDEVMKPALERLHSEWQQGYPLSQCVADYANTLVFGPDTHTMGFYDFRILSWRSSGCPDLQRFDP